MRRSFIRATAFFAIVTLAACQGGATLPPPPVTGAAPLAAGDGEIPLRFPDAVRAVCPAPTHSGEMRCFALERADLRADTLQGNAAPSGYGPQDLQNAYKIASGTSSKVAIVDAYGYPQAASDLAAYRAYYKLPACTTANGCLAIRNQTGGTNPPPANSNWDFEQALDLDMVSALCPKCQIVLVQANSAYTTDLYAAVKEAAALGAVVISNSYGGSEYSQCGGPGESSDPAFALPGHVYVASAGDYGGGLTDCGGPQQPCSLPTVVCAGGTKLVHASNARRWKESTWNELKYNLCGGSCGGTGSGCSIVVKKPSWQNDTGCKMRSEADVSAEASVLAPVAMYYGGWTAAGGTSVSAPIIAGIFGRAGNASKINGPQQIWLNRTHLFGQDVGSNVYQPVSGSCASSIRYICYAAKGYDGPTGWGTPNGLAAF